MKTNKIEDLMVPLSEYATVIVGATLFEAILALEKAQGDFDQTKYRHRAILVLDKAGDCAAIEFLNGRMTVHRGAELPVAALTNDTYARSLECLHQGRAPLLDTYSSIGRFIKAAHRVQHCRADTGDEMLAYAFDTLAAVASGRTQWRIVYDNRGV